MSAHDRPKEIRGQVIEGDIFCRVCESPTFRIYKADKMTRLIVVCAECHAEVARVFNWAIIADLNDNEQDHLRD